MLTTEIHHWLDSIAKSAGLFVTGTDTGVGKTWVGCQIIKRLQQQGVRVAPRKPVESGWPVDPSEWHTTDAAQLAGVADVAIDQVCGLRFKAPLSPPRAAQLEQYTLTIADLKAACERDLPAGDFLYVEGAGGLYSPLAEDGLNADLAQHLGLPVLLVTEDRVGCINHVLLALEALQQRRLNVAGVVLNPIQPAPAGMDNLTDLRQLTTVPVIRWQ